MRGSRPKKPAGKTVVESPAKRHRKRERKSKSASKGQPKVVTPMTATPTPSNNPMTAPRVRACKLIEVPIVSPELETLPRYSRYAQEKFLMPVAIPGQTDLGINTLGSNLNKKSGTRESVVREGIRARYNSTIERPIRTVTRFSRRPIIVVPQAMSSLITLHNAKELLEQLHFVQPEMQRPLGTLRPEEVAIEREFSDGKLKKYRIIDNVSKLCPDEWQRVIAVFALGPHWQFKGWPWHGDAAVIFHKVCAFHLYYKDVGVHKDLLNMEINSLEISKNEPHTHSSILMQFWATLDKYVRTQGQFSFLVKERVYFPE
ncbi:parafibromin [Drosophila obscura]|uniref:parafibromin n=1 Tax=Drosophila obscura TaxID=7282 RepID=UPI001BB138AE|nr:parafibromin [Drosophila obscura]XP_022224778.2 parafibromin [Drosophila obscura]XP_022224779.2 parafibromin [Drosophila obscura]